MKNDAGLPLRIYGHQHVKPAGQRGARVKGKAGGKVLKVAGGSGNNSIVYKSLVEWVSYRDRIWEPAAGLDQGVLEEYWQKENRQPE